MEAEMIRVLTEANQLLHWGRGLIHLESRNATEIESQMEPLLIQSVAEHAK
jgi:hypothetical protein